MTQNDNTCIECDTRAAVTTDGLYCRKCLRRKIAHDNPIPKRRSAEHLDRRDYEGHAFDCELVDFDAECGLGGRPDYDAWMAPEPGEEEDIDEYRGMRW